MNKIIIMLALFVFSLGASANRSEVSSYFQGKSGCFILFNLNQNKFVTEYNHARCEERISPDSTFKIPLSLMAFDQKLITQETIFKWDGKNNKLPPWNHDQTPQTWLKNSTVWVSQEITPKLGMDEIQLYLNKFHYGNQDFSGDSGKNNGLTQAWLSSSLKISAYEQLKFIKSFLTNKLPVSHEALSNTKENMFVEISPQGWKLYGKTGTGDQSRPTRNGFNQFSDGWFIGFVEKNNQTYIVITNFTEPANSTITEAAGPRARAITKAILNDVGLI